MTIFPCPGNIKPYWVGQDILFPATFLDNFSKLLGKFFLRHPEFSTLISSLGSSFLPRWDLVGNSEAPKRISIVSFPEGDACTAARLSWKWGSILTFQSLFGIQCARWGEAVVFWCVMIAPETARLNPSARRAKLPLCPGTNTFLASRYQQLFSGILIGKPEPEFMA